MVNSRTVPKMNISNLVPVIPTQTGPEMLYLPDLPKRKKDRDGWHLTKASAR